MAKQTYPKVSKNVRTAQQIIQDDKVDRERRIREAMRELRRVIKSEKENTSSA